MRQRPTTRARRGGAYLLVLGAAMLVTVIGIASLSISRIQARAAASGTDAAEARLYAQSAIELGLLWIADDPNWRTTYGEGAWATDVTIGSGTFSLEAKDLGPQGDLALSADGDPALLTATGARGTAVHKTQVRLESVGGGGLTCLEASMHAGTDLGFNAATVTSNQIMSANNNATASGAMVTGTVEVVGTASGGTYQTTPVTGITPRAMPDATVFDHYVATGTAISIASIPLQGQYRQIKNVLISPASNPYGPSTNPQGIYVIDCAGANIYIANCRIVGTLVLLNAGIDSQVDDAINWKAATTNYPSLLVQGDIKITLLTSDLSESSSGVNFNPVGTPDDSGVEDADTADVYPTVLRGLVYVSGNLRTYSSPVFDGVVVIGGSLNGGGTVNLTYQPTFLNDPPPGFSTPAAGMQIAAGSWQQVVE